MCYINLSGCLFYPRGFELVVYLYQSSAQWKFECIVLVFELQKKASLDLTASFVWACCIVCCVFIFIQLTNTNSYSYTLSKELGIKASFTHVIPCYELFILR